MINALSFHKFSWRTVYRRAYRNGIKYVFEVIANMNYCYEYDLSKNPFSICVKEYNSPPQENRALYSILLYDFPNRDEAKKFCDDIINKNTIRELIAELEMHDKQLNEKICKQLQTELDSFEQRLQELRLLPESFLELMKTFDKDLSYMARAYYKKKYMS